MNITGSITYPYDERILQLFEPETKQFERATYMVSHHGDQVLFTIRATDATALRACMTTITKILSVWETSAAAWTKTNATP